MGTAKKLEEEGISKAQRLQALPTAVSSNALKVLSASPLAPCCSHFPNFFIACTRMPIGCIRVAEAISIADGQFDVIVSEDNIL